MGWIARQRERLGLGSGRSSSGAWAAADRPRPRVGIVTAYSTRKGICTLARAIEMALAGREGSDEASRRASIFPARRIRHLDRGFSRERADAVEPALRHPLVAPPGTPFVAWLAGHDVVIFVEVLHPRIFRACRERGIRTVLVALLDCLPEDPAERRAGVRDLDRVVVHSEQGAARLLEEGFPAVLALPPGLDWPCHPSPPATDRIRFYFNVGVGGPHDRRNVPLVLDTFRRLLPAHPEVRLTVKMLPEARERYPDLGPLHPAITVVESRLSPEEMVLLQRDADVTLFPSRFEGLGYPLLESLHAGVPVVATDAPPMNEIIREGENGLLVRARPGATQGLQTMWDLDPEHFRAQVGRLVGEEGRALIARFKEGAVRANAERQSAFRRGWESVIAELARAPSD